MKLEMENLTVGYGSKDILTGINLTLEGPGLYCIIGPNGVGKSTLIKCINKILTPKEGTVRIDGVDVKDMKQIEVAQKVAYVPVTSEDVFAMTVFDTVMIGRANKQKWRTTPEDIVKVNLALEVMGMSEYAQGRFNELSAGQHQIIAIARGLVQETEILILDEPTSNLDVRHMIFVTSLLREIAVRKGIMVVMISHNLNIATMFADEVILMSPPGTVKQIGPTADVVTKENIEHVYNVGCDIIDHEGRPMMLLNRILN